MGKYFLLEFIIVVEEVVLVLVVFVYVMFLIFFVDENFGFC